MKIEIIFNYFSLWLYGTLDLTYLQICTKKKKTGKKEITTLDVVNSASVGLLRIDAFM